ncbi:MAG: hypothetical protein NXH75_08105 [Halobacteriovoraceae bacterium]|nr:hypothetical protein [Halobacteriovoraceae bacterium]
MNLKQFKTSLIILWSCITTPLFAQDYGYEKNLEIFNLRGGWASGGGNAVVCFKSPEFAERVKANDGIIENDQLSNIESIEMYDNFEARLPRGLEQKVPALIKIRDTETFGEYSKRLARRFNPYVPSIGQVIYSGMNALPNSNIRFFEGPVKQVNDIDTPIGSIDRSKCVITTMAIQRNFNGYFSLYIDSRLFNHPNHSKQSKATLVLHEYIYTVARERSQTNSATTRELVGVTLTQHPDFTVNYVSFLAYNLGFGWGVYDDRLGKDGFIAYSALVDMMVWQTAVALKSISRTFINLGCVKCTEFIEAMNIAHPIGIYPDSFALSSQHFRQTMADINYSQALVELLVEAENEYRIRMRKVIQEKINAIKLQYRSLPARSDDRELLDIVLDDFFAFFLLDPLSWDVSPEGSSYTLSLYENKTENEVQMELQYKFLKEKELWWMLSLDLVIP